MTKRLLKIALVIAVVGGIGFWAFTPGAVPADFAVVARGTLEVTVSDEGRTRVRDRFVVSAPLPGRMNRIALEPGDPRTDDRCVGPARGEPAGKAERCARRCRDGVTAYPSALEE